MEIKKSFKKNGIKKYKKLEDINGEIVCTFNKFCINEDLINNIIKNYKTPGVWALFGLKNEEWICLQVAQKSSKNLDEESIGCEIASDLQMMGMIIPKKCKQCKNIENDNRAFFTKVYQRHCCETCEIKKNDKMLFQERFNVSRGLKRKEKIRNLSRRFDIYHTIADEYNNMAVICISKDSNKEIVKELECSFAEEHLAIFFQDLKYCNQK